jgi:hypothetical protein
MTMIWVQAQDNNANGYLGCFKWYLDSKYFFNWYLQVVSRSWATSDILQVVLIKIANVQEKIILTNPTSGSMIEDSSNWYHTPIRGISTHDIIYTRRWFHKWSSTLSDHQMEKVPSHTRAQDYQVNDPCYDIGGGAPRNGIKVKDPK